MLGETRTEVKIFKLQELLGIQEEVLRITTDLVADLSGEHLTEQNIE